MANAIAILQKLSRNFQILGLTIASQSQTQVVVSNGSNNITVSYVNAVFSPSVIGGVDPSVSPFLGIGVGNPGEICIQSATGTTLPTILDGAVAAQVFASCASMANDILFQDNTGLPTSAGAGVQLARIRGQSDLLNMGQ